MLWNFRRGRSIQRELCNRCGTRVKGMEDREEFSFDHRAMSFGKVGFKKLGQARGESGGRTERNEQENSQDETRGLAITLNRLRNLKEIRHEATLKVEAALSALLTGKGRVAEQIGESHGVELKFGPKKDGYVNIVVNGPSEESLSSAISSIECSLQKGVASPALGYSHFVSIPLACHEDLTKRLVSLRESVFGPEYSSRNGTETSDSNGMENSSRKRTENSSRKELPRGMCKSIFVNPSTFHLTVQMLKLWNSERLQQASEVLQKSLPMVHDALEGRPLLVRLGKLVQMRGSPEKVHVVYAHVTEADGSNRLMRACEVLRMAYREAGLVTAGDEKEHLKLHATVINTSHRKRSMKRVPVDARAILAEHGEADWGEYRISDAQLSQRFVFDSKGYYHCCSKIEFP